MKVDKRSSLATILLAGSFWLLPGTDAARGEIFELASGGEIRGNWINRDERPLVSYLVELPSGGRLRLEESQVRQVVRQSPQQLEYERLAVQCGNTVDAQWKMAEWCRQKQLLAERENHLNRILELDADHTPARRALGYSHLNGEWVRQDEWRKSNGYQLYQGRWRLSQEIEILERRRKQELAEKEWLQKLRRLRGGLADASKGGDAREQMAAITDVNAIPALREMLKTEPFPALRVFYVEMLGKIGGASSDLLMQVSILDIDEEVRYAALDQIAKLDPPHGEKFYITCLKDQNNVKINRAALAIGHLGYTGAIDALIDALITVHVVTLKGASNSPDATSTSFSGEGGTSFQQGAGPKSMRVHAQNDEVLKSLVKLAGGSSFQFDVPSWRAWRDSRRQAGAAGALPAKR